MYEIENINQRKIRSTKEGKNHGRRKKRTGNYAIRS